MMLVLLIAGIGVVVAGLLAIGFGIPVKEFGFGNTLILTGTIGVCTGFLILGMAVVLRELKASIARSSRTQKPDVPRIRRDLPFHAPDVAPEPEPASELDADFDAPLSRDRTAPDRGITDAIPPWQEEVGRDRERVRTRTETVPQPEEVTPEPKRRNLMFSSSRRERERAAAQAAEAATTVQQPTGSDQQTFEHVWPQSEPPSRLETPRRAPRTPSTFTEPATAPVPEVTVLKSGVVDGMAYSLYSDGSIEAQMPEGMMRFASIDELREHLDQRG